jgi:hypothetical protein
MAILRVISRRLVLQHEASFVNTAAFPSSSYFFRHRSAPDDPLALDTEGIIWRLAAAAPQGRGHRSVRPSQRHVRRSAKIGRASRARRLAPRVLQPHCAAVGGVERRCGERGVVRQEKFHDCGDFIRPPATTDSCDTGEGDPEGPPFAFTDVFY